MSLAASQKASSTEMCVHMSSNQYWQDLISGIGNVTHWQGAKGHKAQIL